MANLKYTTKTIFILFFILTLFKVKSQDKIFVDKVVAIVGKNIILKSDIQKTILQLESQGQDLSEFDNIECSIFEQLLFENLLQVKAEIDSIEISNEEVENHVEQRIQTIISQVGSVPEMEKFYNQTEDEIRNQAFITIKKQLLAQRAQQSIISDIDITPEEVRVFFNKISKDEIPKVEEEFELAQLVIHPKLTQDSKDAVMEKLHNLRNDILEGSSFRAKAALYSEDPGSASKGGEYKGIKRGVFVKEFEAVAFNLSEGEISEPVETVFGFHIIQLIKRRGDELDLRHILIKPKYNSDELEKAQNKIDSLRTMILKDSIPFDVAVRYFSEDKDTKSNGGLIVNYQKGSSKMALEDLSPNVYAKIRDLKVGDISDVIYGATRKGEQEFKIILLKNKIAPHIINFKQDYNKIKNIALEEKKQNTTKKWKDDNIEKTFIKINDYRDCNFESKWILGEK